MLHFSSSHESITKCLLFNEGLQKTICDVKKLKMSYPSKIIVIGIAGSSGSGKSFFADKLADLLPNSTIISLDNYFQREKVVDNNFDAPNLTDIDLLYNNILDIKNNKSTKTPIYSFTGGGTRIGFIPTLVPKSRILIIEGIYAMKEILRSLYDIKISITGGTHFDVIKRLIRDITRVGQNPSELICSIAETVFPMYKIFIEPDLNFTSIKINNTYNPFQDIQDPLYILNIKKILTIDQIKEKISDKHVKEKIEENLDIYMYMPNDNTKSFNNWIRIRQNLKDYKYYLMFSEWESDDIFIKSPQIEFEVNVKIIGCLISLGYVICFNVNRTSNIFYYTKGLFEGSYISVDNFPSLQLTNIQINGNKKEIIQKIGIDLDLQDNYHQIPCIDLLLKRIN